MDSNINLSIVHNWEIGQNMPPKNATTSNVRYDGNMCSDVTSHVRHSEKGMPSLIALFREVGKFAIDRWRR